MAMRIATSLVLELARARSRMETLPQAMRSKMPAVAHKTPTVAGNVFSTL